MTAEGILYVDENCRDVFEKELDEWFGKDKWRLEGSDFGDYALENMPEKIEVDVYDEEQESIIGKVEIKNDFVVAETCFGERYIECEPKAIRRINTNEKDIPKPPKEFVQNIGNILSKRSNFFTFDMAMTEQSRRWIVTETGDGGVSGLAVNSNPMAFYNNFIIQYEE